VLQNSENSFSKTRKNVQIFTEILQHTTTNSVAETLVTRRRLLPSLIHDAGGGHALPRNSPELFSLPCPEKAELGTGGVQVPGVGESGLAMVGGPAEKSAVTVAVKFRIPDVLQIRLRAHPTAVYRHHWW
jgi:hypothetical protein